MPSHLSGFTRASEAPMTSENPGGGCVPPQPVRRERELSVPAPARPHISAALQHLRFGVTLCGSVLCLALVAQMIIWACVHFMDLRTRHLGPEAGPGANLTVVTRSPGEEAVERTAPNPPRATPAARSLIDGGAARSRGAVSNAAPEVPVPDGPADVNIVQAPGDLVLSRFAAVVQAVGIVAALALALLMVQGVLVASGAQVPGVEYCVTASFWGMVIGLVCVPMTGLVPGSAFPGVFASYGVMAEHADLYRGGSPTALGGPGYYGLFLLMPVATALGVAACVLRFRAGVEEGVIVTHTSQLDEKVEREIRSGRDKWSMMQGRAVGALNSAMGDPVARVPGSGAGFSGGIKPGMTGVPGGPITGMAAGAESMGPRPGEPPEPPPGLALRRPI